MVPEPRAGSPPGGRRCPCPGPTVPPAAPGGAGTGEARRGPARLPAAPLCGAGARGSSAAGTLAGAPASGLGVAEGARRPPRPADGRPLARSPRGGSGSGSGPGPASHLGAVCCAGRAGGGVPRRSETARPAPWWESRHTGRLEYFCSTGNDSVPDPDEKCAGLKNRPGVSAAGAVRGSARLWGGGGVWGCWGGGEAVWCGLPSS